MHGGGNAPGYTPIADDSGAVIEARPEYYGLLLFALAGTGTLLETQLSAGGVDVTAYAVRTPSGGLNIILVNKDTLQNLTLTIQANQPIEDCKHPNHDRSKPGRCLRSHHSGRHDEQGRQLCSGKPWHADSRGRPDNLLPPGAQRRAYQHHLRLQTLEIKLSPAEDGLN